jgi:NTP pyrophosphatase (non-canonical NTP hydrolase)
MDKYTETKQILNDMASIKMAMNSHKGNIEDIHPSTIIKLMGEEVAELSEAIAEQELMQILQEAADVQNFLLALVHQQIHLYRNRKDD